MRCTAARGSLGRVTPRGVPRFDGARLARLTQQGVPSAKIRVVLQQQRIHHPHRLVQRRVILDLLQKQIAAFIGIRQRIVERIFAYFLGFAQGMAGFARIQQRGQGQGVDALANAGGGQIVADGCHVEIHEIVAHRPRRPMDEIPERIPVGRMELCET